MKYNPILYEADWHYSETDITKAKNFNIRYVDVRPYYFDRILHLRTKFLTDRTNRIGYGVIAKNVFANRHGFDLTGLNLLKMFLSNVGSGSEG